MPCTSGNPPFGEHVKRLTKTVSEESCKQCALFWRSVLHLIKVGNDLIQQSQALHSHVVAIQLDVKIVEVWDGSKEDSNLRIGLIVKVLEDRTMSPFCTPQACCCTLHVCLPFLHAHHVPGVGHEEVLGHVCWQKVEENPPVIQLDFLHPIPLLFRLATEDPTHMRKT